jgi:hypothetical protein
VPMAIAFAPEGKSVLSLWSDGGVFRGSLEKDKFTGELPKAHAFPLELSSENLPLWFDPASGVLVAGDAGCAFTRRFLWTKSDDTSYRAPQEFFGSLRIANPDVKAGFSPDGKTLAAWGFPYSSSGDGVVPTRPTLALWEVASGRKRLEMKLPLELKRDLHIWKNDARAPLVPVQAVTDWKPQLPWTSTKSPALHFPRAADCWP